MLGKIKGKYKDGWENLCKVKLKDHFGTEIEVMVLK